MDRVGLEVEHAASPTGSGGPPSRARSPQRRAPRRGRARAGRGSGPSAPRAWQPPARAGAAASVGSSGCAAASPSRATSRSRSRGRAGASASTARSRRTSRTCTSPTRSSALLDGAARRGVKELLVLTGEAPDHHPGVRERLGELGLRGLRRLRRVGLRAGARARAAAAHEPRRARRATTSRACAR